MQKKAENDVNQYFFFSHNVSYTVKLKSFLSYLMYHQNLTKVTISSDELKKIVSNRKRKTTGGDKEKEEEDEN